ncbi:MAG: hypothetical protein NC483_05030 [Ruminococcus sp.]|nr:hypothetical protein [Ruminococcus sp.]
MNKIQLVTYNPNNYKNYDCKMDIKNFNELNALDNYEINIFNLNCEEIWWSKNNRDKEPSLDIKLSDDFKSIHQMISNSKKSKTVICLPQNINYRWKYYDETKSKQLKNMIPIFSKIIDQLILISNLELVYENSNTIIASDSISASFYFNSEEFAKLTVSKDSEKITTISEGNIIITTLNIIDNTNCNILISYLYEIGLINDEVEYPEWLYKYNFNDDEFQNNNIIKAKEQIKIQKEIIEKSNQKLQENLRYKSVLFNNSDLLVEVVFEILECVFEISLKEFKDEKKEDFLFKKDGITYIGEIKGVTSNVKYEHISQLDVHYSKYLDKLQEEDITENIKKLLIMNYERTKDISLRDEINQMQIDLAEKNETLIIDTKTLLTLYERLLQGKTTKDKVIDCIKSSSGVINLDKI